MDGVSSSFAVISLAFQLLDTVQKASGFVKDIQDAPRELLELSATLDQLHPILKEVHDYLTEMLEFASTWLTFSHFGCFRAM